MHRLPRVDLRDVAQDVACDADLPERLGEPRAEARAKPAGARHKPGKVHECRQGQLAKWLAMEIVDQARRHCDSFELKARRANPHCKGPAAKMGAACTTSDNANHAAQSTMRMVSCLTCQPALLHMRTGTVSTLARHDLVFKSTSLLSCATVWAALFDRV